MKIRQGFIVCAFIAVVVAGLSRLLVFGIQCAPETFGTSAAQIASKAQIFIEGTLFISVGLVCLGLLNSQTTRRSVKDRFKDMPNPFADDSSWMCR